jgi:steroid 5-alpha reductase family enzyme
MVCGGPDRSVPHGSFRATFLVGLVIPRFKIGFGCRECFSVVWQPPVHLRDPPAGSQPFILPYPKPESTLIETGPYRIVRHPMYSGAILVAFGWALVIHSWLAIGTAMVLFVFFDLKSRREEAWLKEKFPGYATYQQRVRKLVPLIY